MGKRASWFSPGLLSRLNRRVLYRLSVDRVRLVALTSVLLLLSVTMGSMPVGEAQKGSLPAIPMTEYDVEIPCNISVYVDEQNPVTNHNGAMFGDYLRVGTGPEFCGERWVLLDIGPIMEGDGGPIPDDAEITEARVKVYKQAGPSDTVKAYSLQTAFNEGSVTWNTRPDRYSSPTSNTTVPASNGWTHLNFPVSALNDAINYDHGVRLAICPTWTQCTREVVFYSDEHSYRPSLEITYLATEGGPTPPPPEPSDDTEPCQLAVTWSPSHPSPGQMVTITATATDNEEMRYVAIYRGSMELARRDATSGQTSLSVSYTEEAVLPSLSYLVTANDRSGETDPVIQMVTIPVVGTGTAPEVTLEIEWEIDEVIPERYRLIREDGQMATITATATDPEGIDYLEIHCNGLGGPRRIDGDGAASVTDTVYWVNDDPGGTTFSCYASAVDMEHNYSSTDAEHIDIVNPGGLLLMTTAAPGFHNPERDRLPWERMVQAFGVGECYWLPNEWKSPYALIWYHAAFKEIADGGECFGMSTLCTEIYQSRVTAHAIEPSASTAAYMSRDNSYTKEWVEARQGGQIGEEVAFKRINEAFHTTSDKLNRIKADLVADKPGVLGIHEGDEGHAIVPWMSRHMPDGTTRVYVYDCNREGGIVQTRDNGPDNPSFDLSNFNHYPYVDFVGSGWSYPIGGSTWNDEMMYFTYEEACGDMGQENEIAGPWGPHLTDHDIPSVLQYMFAPIGGDVDVLIEDEDGNLTGIHEGKVVEDIPGSMAMCPMMGKFSDHEMYVLPMDETLTLRVRGNSEGEYILGILGGGSLMAIEGKDIKPGKEDRITIVPSDEATGSEMRVTVGVADTIFNIMVAHMFDGYVQATMMDFIGREWVMEGTSATDEGDFTVHVDETGGTLVVENHGDDDIEFDVSMRTTESLDEVEGDLEDMPFIPASTEEDVVVGGGETVELTPEDWATTDEKAPLHILRDGKESGPQGSSFPIVPVAIAVGATIAAVLGILVWKGVIGKGKTS